MVQIAPALFVPLIENAFKFASFRNQKPSVKINLSVRERVLLHLMYQTAVKITDQKNHPDHSGYGITNLRKRLDLTYPGRYQLIIIPDETVYNVKLVIDTNAN